MVTIFFLKITKKVEAIRFCLFCVFFFSEGKFEFCISGNCWYIYIHRENGNIYFILRGKVKVV